MRRLRSEGGFAYLAAIVMMVVVAGLIAAMLRLTLAQQGTANDAALVARASQAARGGVEWALYQLTNNAATPCAASTTLNDFAATGFRVTVNCSKTAYQEGQDATTGASLTKNLYTIDAIACNGGGNQCPDVNTPTAPDYTERRRVATVCIQADGSVCY